MACRLILEWASKYTAHSLSPSSEALRGLLPLEQAIVDRELSELDVEPMSSEKAFLKPNRRPNKRPSARWRPPET